MTAGIVGYGRIGRASAALFAGLGFDVLAFDAYAAYAPVPAQPGRVRPAGSLEQLLSSADAVSLHVPGGAGPLLGRERLSLLRQGSVLANTARGQLVDEPPVSVRVVRITPGVDRSPHRHPHSCEVVYVVEGAGTMWRDGTTTALSAGDVVLIPAGMPHATIATGGALRLVCVLPHPDLASNIEELDGIIRL